MEIVISRCWGIGSNITENTLSGTEWNCCEEINLGSQTYCCYWTCLVFILKQQRYLNYMHVYCALNAVATHSAKTEFLRDYLPFAWQIWRTEVKGMLSVANAITARAETCIQSKHHLSPATTLYRSVGEPKGHLGIMNVNMKSSAIY